GLGPKADGAHRYLAVSVEAGSGRLVLLRDGAGDGIPQGAEPRMESGEEYILIWDLTGAGDPRMLTLLPAATTIHSITVVDIP
ncbi:hypothetical protein HQ535_14755, partial [bacterium]|nr:hypothetical protein [bacterium]